MVFLVWGKTVGIIGGALVGGGLVSAHGLYGARPIMLRNWHPMKVSLLGSEANLRDLDG